MNIKISKPLVILFGFFIFSAFLVLQVDIGYQLTDIFHEGEYVGLVWHMLSYYVGTTTFPLVIHGAMDFLPSLTAKIIFGDDRIIIGTRAINSFIVITSWTFFLDLCWKLTNKTGKNSYWIFIPLLLLFLASKNWGIALALHHAFVGPRDLFLIVSLWAFISFKQSSNNSTQIIYMIALILSGIFGLYWSYDRGVMGLLVTLTFMVNILYKNKKNEIWFLLLTIFIAVSFLEYTKIAGSVSDVLFNIIYWIKNGKEIWGNNVLFPISLQALMLPITLLALIPLVILAGRNEYKFKINREILVAVLLIAIEILMIKTIFNRAGLPRTSWGLWPLIAIFIYGASRIKMGIFESQYNVTKKTLSISEIQILLITIPAICLLIAFSNYFYTYPNLSTFNAFKSNIESPKLDTDLVSADLQKVSSKLALLNPGCAFDWTNEGVIALLAHLPICTKYNYAVYAAPAEQPLMIQQLMADNPSAIVFDSPSPSIKIDGKTMRERLPDVFSFIEKNYLHEINVGKYLIRGRRAENPYSYQKLFFTSRGNGSSYLQKGWSPSEVWGTWSEDNSASIALKFPIDESKNDYELNIEAQAFIVEKKHSKQKVSILINGEEIDSIVYDSPSVTLNKIKIPGGYIFSKKNNGGMVIIEFVLNNAISPADLNVGGDARKLGLGLISLQIKPKS